MEDKSHDYTLRYELMALMFFYDTGLLAPGKDSSLLADNRYKDGTREEEWEKWKKLNKSHIRAIQELI